MSSRSSVPGSQRNRWPILIVISVLFVAAIVVWLQVLKPPEAEEAGCNEPGEVVETTTSGVRTTSSTTQSAGATDTAGTAVSTPTTSATSTSPTIVTKLGTFVEPEDLADTRPADPARIALRVYNASTVTGQAKTVTDELRSAGFAAIGQQANDPLYPASDLRCFGEIRYGFAGAAAARTVLLVAPCMQLVVDERQDDSVDLALGKLYELQSVSDEVRDQLAEISHASAPPPVIEGREVEVRDTPPIPPLPDRSHCPA